MNIIIPDIVKHIDNLTDLQSLVKLDKLSGYTKFVISIHNVLIG